MIPLRFTQQDAELAYGTWGANCGPGAIAAIAGLTLEELRPSMGDFEAKRYTNPTLMWQVLNNLGLRWKRNSPKLQEALVAPILDFPEYGLARVQWEGPWTNPGVPPQVAYRHTHWVAASHAAIFDINCMGAGGWVPQREWAERVVPWLLCECVPKANGCWHLTHSVEIDPRSAVELRGMLLLARAAVKSVEDLA